MQPLVGEEAVTGALTSDNYLKYAVLQLLMRNASARVDTQYCNGRHPCHSTCACAQQIFAAMQSDGERCIPVSSDVHGQCTLRNRSAARLTARFAADLRLEEFLTPFPPS